MNDALYEISMLIDGMFLHYRLRSRRFLQMCQITSLFNIYVGVVYLILVLHNFDVSNCAAGCQRASLARGIKSQ